MNISSTGRVTAAAACAATPARFKSAGINIRTGPHASCTSRGLGYRSNTLRVWCYAGPNPSNIWYFPNDRTTGVRGWSRRQYVTITAGGPTPCTRL